MEEVALKTLLVECISEFVEYFHWVFTNQEIYMIYLMDHAEKFGTMLDVNFILNSIENLRSILGVIEQLSDDSSYLKSILPAFFDAIANLGEHGDILKTIANDIVSDFVLTKSNHFLVSVLLLLGFITIPQKKLLKNIYRSSDVFDVSEFSFDWKRIELLGEGLENFLSRDYTNNYEKIQFLNYVVTFFSNGYVNHPMFTLAPTSRGQTHQVGAGDFTFATSKLKFSTDDTRIEAGFGLLDYGDPNEEKALCIEVYKVNTSYEVFDEISIQGYGSAIVGFDNAYSESNIFITIKKLLLENFALDIFEGLSLVLENLILSIGLGHDISTTSINLESSWSLKNVVDTQGLDSFVSKFLASLDDVEFTFQTVVSYSPQTGFRFSAGQGNEIAIPLGKFSFGGITLDNVALKIAPFSDGVESEIIVNFYASLGPVDLVVEEVGASVGFRLDEDQKFSLGVTPPVGVGLSLTTSSISGGGYLFFEPENHRYGGAAQLQLPAINLKAVGLITTRLPDGSKGFSFLIIISAEFQPIQLSFGFTLNGVGGILGINRALDADALRQGMKSGSLDSVLFPEDILGNIPKIVSDLRAIFPPTADQYLFGPTAILGWGTAGVPDEDGVVPSLVTAKLGIVLELPSPFRLSLLGSIRMTFPHPLTPLVDIRLDLFGVIDFGARTAALDAVLFDSRIQLYQVSGDMAFRMKWGEETDFIFSLGGFHPAFTPPPEIPALDRLAVSIGLGGNPRIRLAAYLALTPNTLQIGALLDLYAEKGKFAAKGQLGFDTLITFSPFGFDGRMFGKLDLLAAGTRLMNVDMEVTLTGPTPWRARGTATFKVLKLQHSISFDETFGTPEPAPLPVVEVWPELEAAIENVANWTTQIPGADERAVKVTFRKADEVDGEVLVHPGSTLGFVQRVAPLGLTLEKFGKAYPEGEDYFELESLDILAGPGQNETLAHHGQQSQFAPGEYLELSDDEKLSRPSFEKMDAGWTAQGLEGLEVYGAGWARERNYEALVVDQEYQATLEDTSQDANGTYTPADLITQVASRVGARRQRKFGSQGIEQFATSNRMGISLAPTAYNVADKSEPSGVLSATASAPPTYAQQKQALERAQGASGDDMSYHVIATHESAATYAP